MALGQCRICRCLSMVGPGCGGAGRIGACVEEFLGDPAESSPAGGVQGGHAVASPAVDVRAAFQQQAYQVEHGVLAVAGLRDAGRRGDRRPERRDVQKSVARDRVGIGASVQQQFRRMELPPVHRAVQRGRAPLVEAAGEARIGGDDLTELPRAPEFGSEEAIDGKPEVTQQFQYGVLAAVARGVNGAGCRTCCGRTAAPGRLRPSAAPGPLAPAVPRPRAGPLAACP